MEKISKGLSAFLFLSGQLVFAPQAGIAKAKGPARKPGPAQPLATAVRQPVSVPGDWVACAGCPGRPWPYISLTSALAPSFVPPGQLSGADIMQSQVVLWNNTLSAWKPNLIRVTDASIEPPRLAADAYEFRFVLEQAASRVRTMPDDSQFKDALRRIEQYEERSRNSYEEARRLREAAERQRAVANQAQSFNQQNLSALGGSNNLLAWASRSLSTGSAIRQAQQADRYDDNARVAEQQAQEYADAAVSQRRAAAAAQANMPMVQRHSVALRFSCGFRDNLNGTTLRGLTAQSLVNESTSAADAYLGSVNAMIRRCTPQLPTDGKTVEIRTRVTGVGAKGITLRGGEQMNMVQGDVFHIVRRQSAPAGSGSTIVAKARVVNSFGTHAEAEITDRKGLLRPGDFAVWQFRSVSPQHSLGDFGAAGAMTAFLPYSKNNGRSYADRAAAYARADNMPKALADFATARAAAKTAVDLNHLCWEAATSGVLLDHALAACDAAIALDPKNAHLVDSRAFTLLRLGRFDDAIADYTRALSLDPKLAGSRFGRAVSWTRKGNSAMALADAAAATHLDPNIAARFGGYGVSLSEKT